MSTEQNKTIPAQGQSQTKGHNHSSDSSSSSPTTPTSEESARPGAPDGGWGWMVVLSSFVLSVLVDGVCFSAGIFFTPLRDYFGSSKAETAWVGSVLNGTYLCVGPFVGAFVNRFGCKKVTMVGAVIATSAFFLSTFAPTITVLIFIYGCLGGIGFGLVYLPAMVMVSYYFEQRRALATGIACCGSGIGAFVFAPLSNWLLDVYDWKGATWILSGLVLHGMIFANFYRPLEIPEEEEGQEGDSSEQTQPLLARDDGRQDGEGSRVDSGIACQSDPGCSFQAGGDAVRLVQVVDDQGKLILPREICIEVTPPGHESLATSSSALTAEVQEQASLNVIPECGKDSDSPGAEGLRNLPVQLRDPLRTKNCQPERPLSDVIRSVTPHIAPMDGPESKTFRSDMLHRKLVDPLARLAFSQDALSVLRARKPHVTAHPHPHHSSHHLKAAISSPLLRKDIFYTGSLRSIPEFQSSKSLAEYRRRVTEVEKAKKKKEEEEEEGKKEEEEEKGKGYVARVLCAPLLQVFDISLLKSASFLLYSFSCCLCMLGFFVPFIYLPTLCSNLGMPPSRCAFLISIIGITNTVGRVVAGFVSDQPWADCLLINNVALVIGGVTTCCVPFYPVSYAVFAVYTALFGTCIAVFVALRPIIMVELVGLDKLTSAFGLVIMCQGISTYIGAPIAGMLSDLTGHYNVSFYVAGFFITVSGLLCFPLRRILRWEHSRRSVLTADPEKSLDVPGDVTDDATDDVKCDTEALTSRHSED